MIAARIGVDVGDSGGAVLVRGIPAGVTSRSFGGWLGFTPLAEGLAQLGLELCTTPDCGLVPPAGDPPGRANRRRAWSERSGGPRDPAEIAPGPLLSPPSGRPRRPPWLAVRRLTLHGHRGPTSEQQEDPETR